MDAFSEHYLGSRGPEPVTPLYKRAPCLGVTCLNFSNGSCHSRMELLKAVGETRGLYEVATNKAASYGHVCTGGKDRVVVGIYTESPLDPTSSTYMQLSESAQFKLDQPPQAIGFA